MIDGQLLSPSSDPASLPYSFASPVSPVSPVSSFSLFFCLSVSCLLSPLVFRSSFLFLGYPQRRSLLILPADTITPA